MDDEDFKPDPGADDADDVYVPGADEADQLYTIQIFYIRLGPSELAVIGSPNDALQRPRERD